MDHPPARFKLDGSYLDPIDPHRKVRKVLKKRKGDKPKIPPRPARPVPDKLPLRNKYGVKDDEEEKVDVDQQADFSESEKIDMTFSSKLSLPSSSKPSENEDDPNTAEVPPSPFVDGEDPKPEEIAAELPSSNVPTESFITPPVPMIPRPGKSEEIVAELPSSAPAESSIAPSVPIMSRQTELFYPETPSSDGSADAVISRRIEKIMIQEWQSTKEESSVVEEEEEVSSSKNRMEENIIPSSKSSQTSEKSNDSPNLFKMYFPGDSSDDSGDDALLNVKTYIEHSNLAAGEVLPLFDEEDEIKSNPAFDEVLPLFDEEDEIESNTAVTSAHDIPSPTPTEDSHSIIPIPAPKVLSVISNDNKSESPALNSFPTTFQEPSNFVTPEAKESSSDFRIRVNNWVMESTGYHGDKCLEENFEESLNCSSGRQSSSKVHSKKSSKNDQKVKTSSTKTEVAPSSKKDKSGRNLSPSSKKTEVASSSKSHPKTVPSSYGLSSSRTFTPELPILLPEKYDDSAPPPPNFPGVLADKNEDGREYWRQCPYFGHTYLRPMVHLTKCRDRYLSQCKRQGKEVDIEVCRYVYDHHIPVDKLAEHEATCEYGSMLHTYLIQWAKDQRIQKAMTKAKANAPPK